MSILDRFIRFFLEQKLVVVLLTLFIIGWGVAVAPFDWTIDWMPRDPVPVDAIPNTGENQQIVFTEWPGRSPQDVEDQITYPLTVSLMGVPGVKEVRSLSMFGFSSIFLIFEDDIEFYWSRARILEKLNSLPAGLLPEGVAPALGPDATGLGQIFWYTLEGRDPDGNPVGGWDLHDLRSVQDWHVRYALLSAEGISEVASIGGFVREYQIDIDPDAMRAHDVMLDQVFEAVRRSNLDIGARTTEINRVEYILRGVGFIKGLGDIEQAVVRLAAENVPIRVKDVATVTLGPAERRGVLTNSGAEAVGGVVVVREGYNPLAAINNVKQKIAETEHGLPARVVIDWTKATPQRVERFARMLGFEAFAPLAPGSAGGPHSNRNHLHIGDRPPAQPGANRASAELNHDAWLQWLSATPRDGWPEWITTSRLHIVPFYDRTQLIYETLGTLNDALVQQILVTIIVVIVMVLHLRTSIVVSAMLPLAVLMAFIAMKTVGVDANVVALAGIAIAIGTIVDMGLIISENILKHLKESPPEMPRLEVVYNATREVGSAVLTAISTTIVSFLPVFTMIGAEGKMFTPLAYTKTFVLIGSVIVALTIVPAAAHILIAGRINKVQFKRLAAAGLAVVAFAIIATGLWMGWSMVWPAGLLLLGVAIYHLIADFLPPALRLAGPWTVNIIAAVFVGWILTTIWEPLGPKVGLARNFIFVVGLLGGLLTIFILFQFIYAPILRLCLRHKLIFLSLPTILVIIGFGYVWLGPRYFFGPIESANRLHFTDERSVDFLITNDLLERRDQRLLWTGMALGLDRSDMRAMLDHWDVPNSGRILSQWERRKRLTEIQRMEDREVQGRPLRTMLRRATRDWNGLGREFLPRFDEGTFLWMPTTMPHASIGEALEVLRYQDMAMSALPEVESVFGKIGRVESALDPAPVAMVETIINYKSEYITDPAGRRINFRYDRQRGEFVRDEQGELIPDPRGRPYRQWRDHIRTPQDLWDALAEAAHMPGTTSASLYHPIEIRQIMLQTGMRASMGVKVSAPDLETLDRMAVQIERFLREVPAINPPTVNADRVVGKPYLEIVIDRERIGRYGLNIGDVQDVIGAAIGGETITTTVEGRERYPVRVRYPRELRQDIESLERVLIPAHDGAQIPLMQVADIRYTRGPDMIKSENTFLVAYITFGAQPHVAERSAVEAARDYLNSKVASGELIVPTGVSWRFAGAYEHELRAAATLRVVIPVALGIILLILYFQFRSVLTAMIIFSGIAVAWAGGFFMIYLYGQEWFANFDIFGVNMRETFNLHAINLSVAVWVGFLALFGIAVDDGVVMSTYLRQSFASRKPESIEQIREATGFAGQRRVRPCLMTSATTILALLPVLTSTGRGADLMIPMAIPSVGGMTLVLLTMFTVPVLYCLVQEMKWRLGREA